MSGRPPSRTPRRQRRTDLPPALIPLALVALGVPAGIRALVGRPRSMTACWALSAAGVLLAQTVGEIGGWRIGTIGDAQVLFACVGAALASLAVVALEGLRG